MMHCLNCDTKGDNKSHFCCDVCKAVNCVGCNRLTATEERCLPLRERKLKIMCNTCQEDMSKLFDMNRKIKKENESLKEKIEEYASNTDILNLKEIINENETLKSDIAALQCKLDAQMKLADENKMLKQTNKALQKRIEDLDKLKISENKNIKSTPESILSKEEFDNKFKILKEEVTDIKLLVQNLCCYMNNEEVKVVNKQSYASITAEDPAHHERPVSTTIISKKNVNHNNTIRSRSPKSQIQSTDYKKLENEQRRVMSKVISLGHDDGTENSHKN